MLYEKFLLQYTLKYSRFCLNVNVIFLPTPPVSRELRPLFPSCTYSQLYNDANFTNL